LLMLSCERPQVEKQKTKQELEGDLAWI